MRLFIALMLAFGCSAAEPNYDESKVGGYTLPDPLTLANGQKVRDARTWERTRRSEIFRRFESEVYGRTVPLPARPLVETASSETGALAGKALRKQIDIWFTGKKAGPKMSILLYLPAGARGPAPAFVGLNFGGNHTVQADPGIRLGDVWTKGVKAAATEAARGRDAESWQVEKIVTRGYALATAYYSDIEPDFIGGIKHGIRPLSFKPGQAEPAPDEWGAIGAWAWGLSRIVDVLERDPAIDARHIALMGHSRLGKTALWAGAMDTRFALVISNDSGEAGAALSRRIYGEDIEHLNVAFPHWFAGNYKQYNGQPERLPVDMHELLALIAPRPVYIASAVEDRWADPRGEFLSAVAAGPVYELLGKQGLGTDAMPELHQPIMRTIGYHIRAGKHDVTAYDWDQYLDFADRHFGRR